MHRPGGLRLDAVVVDLGAGVLHRRLHRRQGGRAEDRPQGLRPLLVPDGEGGANRSSTGAWPHVLSGGPWSAYGTARLPPGAYDISMRAVGATDKHTFSRTWTRSLSPLYLSSVQEKQLPPPDGDGCGLLSARILHFFDSTGGRCHVTLPLGQLSPQNLAAYLGRAMSLAARKRGAAAIEVTFEPEARPRESPPGDCWCIEGRFRFKLADAGASGILPSPPRFGLEFDNGSTALDPSLLGFDRATYTGAASYTSPSVVCLPYPSGEEASSGTRGLWFAEVVGTTRRLRFSCEPQPECLLFVEGNEDSGAVSPPAGAVLARISVHHLSSGRPWAHGYRRGEFVQLRSRRGEDDLPEEILCATEGGGYAWKRYSVPAIPAVASELTLRVAAVDDADGDAFSTLWVEVPSDVSSGLPAACGFSVPPGTFTLLYLAGRGASRGLSRVPAATSTRFHSNGERRRRRGAGASKRSSPGPQRRRDAWPLTSWSCWI